MARGANPTQELSQIESNRELRKGYRDLQQSIQRSKDDLGDFSKDSLQEALGNANLLHERVNRPREQAKDSEVFCTLAASGVEQAKKLAAGAKSRTAKDIIRRLKFRFASDAQADVEEDPTAYDWVAAGDHCLHLFGCAVGVGCMLGAMAAQPKVRKVAQRQQKTKLGVLEKPKEIQNIRTEDKQETDRVMEDMFDVIAAHTPVGWLELVMNHNSFSQTAENIFTLSFLVRDAKVSFVPDKELGMLVHAHNPKTDKGTDDSKERVQSMQSYGMDDWESWKDYIEPHQCLMEHRTGDIYNSHAAPRPSANGNTLRADQEEQEGDEEAELHSAVKGKRKNNKGRRAARQEEEEDNGEAPQGLSEEEGSDEETCRATKSSKRSRRHR
ncbi:MAG: hypothetical protein FRX49_10383 [Trebouxia sp. A1-2]|nr:MAG: hypothetical protein FRX49_10383 [Trebouxia sp. A1-2]